MYKWKYRERVNDWNKRLISVIIQLLMIIMNNMSSWYKFIWQVFYIKYEIQVIDNSNKMRQYQSKIKTKYVFNRLAIQLSE